MIIGSNLWRKGFSKNYPELQTSIKVKMNTRKCSGGLCDIFINLPINCRWVVKNRRIYTICLKAWKWILYIYRENNTQLWCAAGLAARLIISINRKSLEAPQAVTKFQRRFIFSFFISFSIKFACCHQVFQLIYTMAKRSGLSTSKLSNPYAIFTCFLNNCRNCFFLPIPVIFITFPSEAIVQQWKREPK